MTGVDLADEDEKFLKYLADNGWEGEVGDDEDGFFAESSRRLPSFLASRHGPIGIAEGRTSSVARHGRTGHASIYISLSVTRMT